MYKLMSKMEVTFYIDASYFIFYRFYALVQWWKVAKKEEPLGVPIETPEFVEKFRSTFIEKVKEIPKKCGVNPKKVKVNMYAARDCPRADIWRNELFPDYKGNRNYEGFQGGQQGTGKGNHKNSSANENPSLLTGSNAEGSNHQSSGGGGGGNRKGRD